MVDRRIADIHNNKQAKKGYKYYSSDGKVYIGLETGRLQLTDQTVDVSNVNFSSCIPQIRVETLVPCNGTINVDGNFGVNGDIQANNFVGNGQTILNVSTYNVVSYSQLQNLVNTNALQATSYYLISDFRTTFKVLGTGTLTDLQGPVEPILVMATSLSTLSPIAYSPSRPNDILHYSLNDVTQLAPNDLSISKGVITYREDTSKDLSAYYDWRAVTFRRWESSPGSLFYAWPVPYPGTGGYYDFYTFTDPNGGNNQYCHIGYYTINVAMIGDYNFGITIAERCGGIGSGITIQDFNTEIKIDQNCATVASSGSFAPPGIYIGTNNIYVNIGKRTYSVYIDNACYALELGIQQNNIAIPSNTWRKRIEKGFSNFECTLDITGLTTIDLVNNSISIAGGNLASPVAYCGILNLVSSNANETINKIEGLPNSTAFAPYRLKPESGLSLTIVDKTVAGGTANMILNVNNITVDGTRSEYAVFNRYMLTLGNVTSDFVLETTNIRELFSVYVDGTTITGDGTVGNPLVATGGGGGGGFSFTKTTVTTSPYTVIPVSGYNVYLVDTSLGSITMNFPTAVGNTAWYVVKKIDSSANTVVLDPNGAQTLDGQPTQTIRFQNTSVDIYSDNSNLFIA
jgi:hypothetical protein